MFQHLEQAGRGVGNVAEHEGHRCFPAVGDELEAGQSTVRLEWIGRV